MEPGDEANQSSWQCICMCTVLYSRNGHCTLFRLLTGCSTKSMTHGKQLRNIKQYLFCNLEITININEMIRQKYYLPQDVPFHSPSASQALSDDHPTSWYPDEQI